MSIDLSIFMIPLELQVSILHTHQMGLLLSCHAAFHHIISIQTKYDTFWVPTWVVHQKLIRPRNTVRKKIADSLNISLSLIRANMDWLIVYDPVYYHTCQCSQVPSTLSLSSSRSTFSQPFTDKYSEVERMGSITIVIWVCVMLYFWWGCWENWKLIIHILRHSTFFPAKSNLRGQWISPGRTIALLPPSPFWPPTCSTVAPPSRDWQPWWERPNYSMDRIPEPKALRHHAGGAWRLLVLYVQPNLPGKIESWSK